MRHKNTFRMITSVLILIFFLKINVIASEQETGIITNSIDEREATTSAVLEVDYVKVTDVDLGDYIDEMTEGDNQLLYVTPLPSNATNQMVTYASQDEEVATVNALGRITAIDSGTTIISVYAADSVIKSFELKVTKEESNFVGVEAIDLGIVEETMEIGESQTLYPSTLPIDATDTTATYASSNEEVAIINSFARILAISVGATAITAKVGTEEESFILTVKEKEEVKAREMDLGEVDNEMKVGETQIISPSILPYEAMELEVKYESSMKEIATINSFGRITAIAEGDTIINVMVGDLEESFELHVNFVDKDAVEDIEISMYEEEMETEETQILSTTILPKDIIGLSIVYASSNSEVAKIDSNGRVQALGPGETIITITAGSFSKEIKIEVVVATTMIEVNKNYFVMKPEETYLLESQVYPIEANQQVAYEVLDSSVATIDNNGLITAHRTGQTTIILDNDFLTIGVTIIVNEPAETAISQELVRGDLSKESVIIKTLQMLDDENIPLSISMIPKVSGEVLRYLHDEQQMLTLENGEYSLIIDGNKIRNYENEFIPSFGFDETEEGLSFIVNEQLPGEIGIVIDDRNYEYLYMMNSSKGIYEMVDYDFVDGMIKVDMPGVYLLTNEQLNKLEVNSLIIIGGVITVIGILVAYVVAKKRYWFW